MANNNSPSTEVTFEPAAGLVERLCEQARFFADNLAMGLPAVIAERQRLEEIPGEAEHQVRLAFLKREQEAGLMGSVRLEIYRRELLRHPPFCPYCWMLNGRRMALKQTLDAGEALGCEVCGSVY